MITIVGIICDGKYNLGFQGGPYTTFFMLDLAAFVMLAYIFG